MSDERLTVYECWSKARHEFPDNHERRRERYVQLMREQRHIVPGKPKPLPCGWGPTSRITDLLTPDEQARLDADLTEMAAKRRRAMDGLSDWQMP